MVQCHHRIAALQILLDRGVVGDRNVQPAVIVAVEQSHAATRHGVEHVVAIKARLWHGSDSGLRGNISKMQVCFRMGSGSVPEWSYTKQSREHKANEGCRTGHEAARSI